jgi:hypothetical protein
MLWVTWRQQRATFISVPAVLAAAAVLLLVAAARVRGDYADLMAQPVHSAAWQTLKGDFNNGDWAFGQAMDFVMQVVPVLIGTFAGAPVLARELENGTFRYAWTQGLRRERWVIAKLALLGAFVAALAAAFSGLFGWFFHPFMSQEAIGALDATVFDTRPVAFAAWTLAAFTLAACSGMLLRRILPAMAVSLGAYLGLSLLTGGILRGFYSGSGFWPAQLAEGGWLLALSVLLIGATVWLARRRAA